MGLWAREQAASTAGGEGNAGPPPTEPAPSTGSPSKAPGDVCAGRQCGICLQWDRRYKRHS
eukprot:460101-Alexandrium_andersonii.AAC.1